MRRQGHIFVAASRHADLCKRPPDGWPALFLSADRASAAKLPRRRPAVAALAPPAADGSPGQWKPSTSTRSSCRLLRRRSRNISIFLSLPVFFLSLQSVESGADRNLLPVQPLRNATTHGEEVEDSQAEDGFVDSGPRRSSPQVYAGRSVLPPPPSSSSSQEKKPIIHWHDNWMHKCRAGPQKRMASCLFCYCSVAGGGDGKTRRDGGGAKRKTKEKESARHAMTRLVRR